MTRTTSVARDTETDARLEQIKHLSQQVAAAPVDSREHDLLSAAIRVEAAAYRKSLDIEQAASTRDADPRPAVERGSLNTRRTVGPDG